MKKYFYRQSAQTSIVGFLLAIAIMFFIGYGTYDFYLNKHSSLQKSWYKSIFPDEKTSNKEEVGIFDDMKERIKGVNRATMDRQNQLPQEYR